MAKARDYKREYRKFHSSPEAIRERDRRNHDRREAEKKGLVHKGDNKDIDHPKGDACGPYRVLPRSLNRSRGVRKANRRPGRENKSA